MWFYHYFSIKLSKMKPHSKHIKLPDKNTFMEHGSPLTSTFPLQCDVRMRDYGWISALMIKQVRMLFTASPISNHLFFSRRA